MKKGSALEEVYTRTGARLSSYDANVVEPRRRC